MILLFSKQLDVVPYQVRASAKSKKKLPLFGGS